MLQLAFKNGPLPSREKVISYTNYLTTRWLACPLSVVALLVSCRLVSDSLVSDSLTLAAKKTTQVGLGSHGHTTHLLSSLITHTQAQQ